MTDFDLQPLIERVRTAGGDRPLENLTEAVRIAGELVRASDLLVSQFVMEARDAGLSWTQIGTSLGVTRQAARQRFVEPTSFDRPGQVDPDHLLPKVSPFSAVRAHGDVLAVQIEISGAWYQLAEIDGVPTADLVAAAKRHYRARWLKRISEDLDNVYEVLGRALGDTADVVLIDAAGRRLQRTVDVTIAKRRAAWRYNQEQAA